MRIQILSTSAVVAVAALLAYPNDALALTDLVVTVDCATLESPCGALMTGQTRRKPSIRARTSPAHGGDARERGA